MLCLATTPAPPLRPAPETKTSALDHAEASFDDLVEWLQSEATLALPLHAVEREHAQRGREVLRLMLQAHIDARGPGHLGPAIIGGAGGEEVYAVGREHPRSLKSVFGTVTVLRRSYCAPGQDSIHPVEQSMAFPSRSFSSELQRRFVKFAVQGPLDEAIENIKDLSGIRIGKGSSEAIIMEAAQDFDEFYKQRKPSQPPEKTGPILCAETDGKGVPMIKPEGTSTPARRKKGEKANKKRMATLGAVYTKTPVVRTPQEVVDSLFEERKKDPKPPRKPRRKPDEPPVSKPGKPENKRIWASLKKSKDELLGEIAAECRRRDPQDQKVHVALTDGEKALQSRVKRWLPGYLLILDIMHALQRLWKLAHVFHKEGTQEALAWVKERTLRVLSGKIVDVVRGIRISATRRRLSGQALKTVKENTAYLHRNRVFMRYDEYLAHGLPIATGNVEGAAKNLVKDRMERSGMRWSEDGAESLLQLRATYLSDDFEDYWAFNIAQEQARLHPHGPWSPHPPRQPPAEN